jgi:DNA ligase-1
VIAFARTCAAIAATSGKLEKIALVADYLRGLDDADLAPAARFFTGNPFPQRDARSLAVGGATIVEAATATWGVDPAALSASYRASGDLGAALGPFVRPPHDLGLFRGEELTPARLGALLDEIAAANGKQAQKRRRVLCERIFGACTDPLEATYVVKILTGELRIGLRAGLVLDAIALAFAREPKEVRRAASAAGDVGVVALAAKGDVLEEVTLAYHTPIAFMLATPLAYGSAYDALLEPGWQVEDKYDGVRAQAHVTAQRVSLFSRTLNDVADAYPEVVAALRALPEDCVLDGELVAVRDGRVLPFRALQPRLQRKTVDADLLREVPVRFVAFDALAHGEVFLLDRPLSERRAQLEALLAGAGATLTIAPASVLASSDAETVHAYFAQARARGDEGLVFKRTDAPYTPGRRGTSWLKLKRELATLDCVVVAVEWGHGKRAQLLSDYTFAVRDGEQLVVIGKAYSGLTDVEIADLTTWFQDHRLPPGPARVAYTRLGLKRREILVEPQIVVEIAFDIVQQSRLHASGYALRFPRIVRLRPDKTPLDADTLARVGDLYTEMLARESGEVHRSP